MRSTGIITSKYHPFNMYRKYGTSDKTTTAKRKTVATYKAGFFTNLHRKSFSKEFVDD